MCIGSPRQRWLENRALLDRHLYNYNCSPDQSMHSVPIKLTHLLDLICHNTYLPSHSTQAPQPSHSSHTSYIPYLHTAHPHTSHSYTSHTTLLHTKPSHITLLHATHHTPTHQTLTHRHRPPQQLADGTRRHSTPRSDRGPYSSLVEFLETSKPLLLSLRSPLLTSLWRWRLEVGVEMSPY